MRRGRPPYPDLLTPREQEVLSLLREGMTNQQIADRLGISLYGARYHVSEILSKLGVSSREEAARWQPEPAMRRRGLFGVLLAPFGKLGGVSSYKLAGVSAIGASGVALGLLALGVLFVGMREEQELPDGLGKIAYVQDGDIWTVDLASRDRQQLTLGGDYGHPQWSPSGEWLLADLEVMRADGSDRHRVQLCSSWSPVEDVMLCIDDDGGTYEKARLERPDGSIVRTIDMAGLVHADDPELETQTVACLEWSPDGSQLACRVNGKRSPSPGMAEADAGAYSRYSGLWVVEVDGSDARELVDNFEIDGDYGEVGIVGWSADGESVLFQVATGFSASITSDGLRLFAVPIHGGEVHQIDGQLLSRDELQDWQSPGQILAITEGAWRATWTNKRIALADLDTGGLRYLTPPETAAFSPAMSPDGRKIAYVAAPDIGDIPGGDDARLGMAKRRIWLMNADGSNKRLLTDDNAYRDERPMWSRDGEYILFTRIDAEYTASLWVVVPRTGFLRQVARLSMAVPPVDPPLWFGFYGYVAWDRYYDWWQP